MKKIAGFVAEFNPFTKGHEYLIQTIKKEINPDLIVVAMSPNFVMRGEPAIFDKWKRAKTALNFGINLILEIPTIYTIQSAEVFARRGIEILNDAGITDLFFGVETTDKAKFMEIIQAMEGKEYQDLLLQFQKDGSSFNSSSKKALITINPDFEDILKGPNNLLALQYERAVKTINPKIIIHYIKRVESGYFDNIHDNVQIQSATALRNSLVNNNYQKYFSYSVEKWIKHVNNDYFPLIEYRLSSTSISDLSNILLVTEGLEYRLHNLKMVKDYTDLSSSLISKRNRETKIHRILTAVLLNAQKIESNNEPLDSIKVLGFDGLGEEHLGSLKMAPVKFISRIRRVVDLKIKREIDFTKIYAMPHQENDLIRMEYSPIIIKKD